MVFEGAIDIIIEDDLRVKGQRLSSEWTVDRAHHLGSRRRRDGARSVDREAPRQVLGFSGPGTVGARGTTDELQRQVSSSTNPSTGGLQQCDEDVEEAGTEARQRDGEQEYRPAESANCWPISARNSATSAFMSDRNSSALSKRVRHLDFAPVQ
jgi:hypothetical protein